MLKPYSRYQPSGIEWLGEVPQHWTITRLTALCRLKSGNAISADLIDDDGPYPVYGGNGQRGYTNSFSHDGNYALIGRQGALCGNVNYATGRFWASEHAVVVTPIAQTDVRWLGELLRAMELNRYSVAAAQPGLAVDDIQTLPVAQPPVEEQRAIAHFLDAQTAKLDTLVTKNRALIEKLKEKRNALISRTVTCGLPPDAARAASLDPRPSLKPSGIEWLGDVPQHWGVSPLGFLTRFQGGATPDKTRSEYWDGPIPWVSPKDMKQSRLSDAEDHISYDALRDSPLSLIPVGAVLVVVRGMILAHSFPVALAEAPLTINQDMKALLAGESVEPRFLAWTLTGLARVIVALADESAHGTRKIETAILAKLPLVVPPLAEQRAIAAYLDRETTKIDRLIAKIESTIDRLQEYRSALITAAVTGKIDVRETAA